MMICFNLKTDDACVLHLLLEIVIINLFCNKSIEYKNFIFIYLPLGFSLNPTNIINVNVCEDGCWFHVQAKSLLKVFTFTVIYHIIRFCNKDFT